MGATELLLAVSIREAVVNVVKSWLLRNRNTTVSLTSGTTTVELSGAQSPDDIQRILSLLVSPQTETSAGQPDASIIKRGVTVGVSGRGGTAAEDITSIPVQAGAIALSASGQFIATARRRISLVFRLNVTLALILAFVLLSGVAICVANAVNGNSVWVAVFGGVSVADLLGIYLFKPIATISAAVVASQRLEVVHMRLVTQLAECATHNDADKRIACQTAVWDSIQHDLAAMSA